MYHSCFTLMLSEGHKFALKIDYASILPVWEVNLSALWGIIYLHSIARFLLYHMDIFIWQSRKQHRNFQGNSNYGSSRKTRILKPFAQHYSVLSKFVLLRLLREIFFFKWSTLLIHLKHTYITLTRTVEVLQCSITFLIHKRKRKRDS